VTAVDTGETFAPRTVFWKRFDVAGLERCTLRRVESGWTFDGNVLLANPAIEVRYTIACDASWHTRSTSVVLRDAGGERRIELAVDDARRWRRDGGELAALRGLVDVDVSVTPATNTLAVRRLGLAIGASATVTAAWVRLPELVIEPLDQRYTRIAGDRYRYESPSFAAELVVDDVGLVRRYGDLWIRCGAPE
jgi:hypothetical protein